jgi:hypothetical protein
MAKLILMKEIKNDTEASCALLGAGVGTGAVVLPISVVSSIMHVFPAPLYPGWQTPT